MSVNVEDLIARKTSRGFPNIQVRYELTLPLVVSDLEEGDIQCIFEHEGKSKVAKRISLSAINMNLILKCVGPFVFNVSEDESYEINTIQEYLDVV